MVLFWQEQQNTQITKITTEQSPHATLILFIDFQTHTHFLVLFHCYSSHDTHAPGVCIQRKHFCRQFFLVQSNSEQNAGSIQ